MDVNISISPLPNTLRVLKIFGNLVSRVRGSTSLNKLIHSSLEVCVVVNNNTASNRIPLVSSSFIHTLAKNLKFRRSSSLSVRKTPLELIPHFTKCFEIFALISNPRDNLLAEEVSMKISKSHFLFIDRFLWFGFLVGQRIDILIHKVRSTNHLRHLESREEWENRKLLEKLGDQMKRFDSEYTQCLFYSKP